MTTIEYGLASINDIQVDATTDVKTGRRIAKAVMIKDEPLVPTERFWTSLHSRFGTNKAFFDYFSHVEVFERIAQTKNEDRVRICVERDDAGQGTLLAVSNPQKPIVVYNDLLEILNTYGGMKIEYSKGQVTSMHTPRVHTPFEIAGDEFSNRFMMATPIDGYGLPNIYLSLLRHICSNGAVGYASAFKQTLQLGKGSDDVGFSITRALDGFNNEEGFVMLRQRFESATRSWASVREAIGLYKLLVKLHYHKQLSATNPNTGIAQLADSGTPQPMGESKEALGSPLITAFHNLTGDIHSTYGIADIDALSEKRQRNLPVKTKVYDLMNFATEVATHHSKHPDAARQTQAWVGQLLSDEYDMEGTVDRYADFRDFWLETSVSERAGK